MTSRSTALVLAAAAALSIGVVVGCQALIASDPTFRCKSDDGCPSGQACATATGACVTPCDAVACSDQGGTCDNTTQACTPGSLSDAGDAATLPDARVDAGPTKPYDLGVECTDDTDCKSTLCVDVRHQSATMFQKVRAVCSKPCCQSTDCDNGFFCHGSDKGGRYCLPMAKAGRGPQGAKAAGDGCTKNSDCRSGLCANTVCADTCCKDASRDPNQCAAGSVCKFSDLEGTRTWNCAKTAASGVAGSSCPEDNTRCISNYCLAMRCRAPCSSDASCSAAIGTACTYAYQAETPEQPLFCFTPTVNQPAGRFCNSDTDCNSALCERMRCMAPCVTDADCSQTPTRQVCRPSTVRTPPLLRCVPAAQ